MNWRKISFLKSPDFRTLCQLAKRLFISGVERSFAHPFRIMPVTHNHYRKFKNHKIDEIKRDLCAAIRRIAMRNGWTQRELARRLHVSEGTASRVVRLQIDRLTLNQLFYYLEDLSPDLKVMISI